MAVAASWKTSHREHQTALAALLIAVVAGVAFVVVTAVFLFPANPSGAVAPVYVGRIESIPLQEPVYYRDSGFIVVRLSESEVIALEDRERCPLLASIGQPSPDRDRIFWDSSFLTHKSDGVFRARCSNLVYDLDGVSLFATPVQQLERYPITVENGLVTVFPPPKYRRIY